MSFIYLVRHGQTPVNARAVLHQTADEAELTELGKRQIQATAEWLQSQQAQVGKSQAPQVYCSTERRAQQSAELISRVISAAKPHAEIDLQERKWGDWSGKVWSEVETVLEDFSLEDRYAFVPPQGESWQQFAHRLQKVWWRLVAAVSLGSPVGDIVIVTHGGVFRALVPEILALPLETSFMIQPANGEVMTFEVIAAQTAQRTKTDRPQILERTDLNFIPPSQV